MTWPRCSLGVLDRSTFSNSQRLSVAANLHASASTPERISFGIDETDTLVHSLTVSARNVG
jgi:hypothetical protein